MESPPSASEKLQSFSSRIQKESPTSLFTKAVKNVMSVGEMAVFSKEEIQNDVRDLKDRDKTSMLGPAACHRGSNASPFDDSGGSFSGAPSKRRKFEDD